MKKPSSLKMKITFCQRNAQSDQIDSDHGLTLAAVPIIRTTLIRGYSKNLAEATHVWRTTHSKAHSVIFKRL